MANPLLIGAILSALGTGLSYAAQRSAIKKQQEEAAREALRQSKLNKRRTDLVMKNLEQYRPESRQKRLQEVTETSRQKMDSVLQKAVSDSLLSRGVSGRVSSGYTLERARQMKAAGDRASQLAELLAKYRAPANARLQEAFANADFAGRDAILGSMAADSARTSQAIMAGIHPNPLLTSIGSGLQSFGMAYGLSGLGGGGASKGSTGSKAPS